MSILHDLRKAFLEGDIPSRLAEGGNKMLAFRDIMPEIQKSIDMLKNQAEVIRSRFEDEEKMDMLNSFHLRMLFRKIQNCELDVSMLRRRLQIIDFFAKLYQNLMDTSFGHSVNTMGNPPPQPHDPDDGILSHTMSADLAEDEPVPSVSEMKDRIAGLFTDLEILCSEAEIIRDRLVFHGKLIEERIRPILSKAVNNPLPLRRFWEGEGLA